MKIVLLLVGLTCCIVQLQALHTSCCLCPGSPKPVDPKKIWDQVEKIVTRISNGQWTLIGIPEAEVQVVEGYLYSVSVWARRKTDDLERRCFIKYWDRPWLHKEPQILEQCCFGFDKPTDCDSWVGTPRPVNTCDLKLWCEVNKIVKKLSQAEWSLVQICGGTRQVVGGEIYDLVVLISKWDDCHPQRICHLKYIVGPLPNTEPKVLSQDCFPCLPEDDGSDIPCTGKPTSKLVSCGCTIKPGSLENIMKGKLCDNAGCEKPKCENATGEPVSVDPEDPELFNQVNEIVQKLSHCEACLLKIMSGTKQVESEVIYDLVILISDSDGTIRQCNLKYSVGASPNSEPKVLNQDCFPSIPIDCGCKTPCPANTCTCNNKPATSKLVSCGCKIKSSALADIVKTEPCKCTCSQAPKCDHKVGDPRPVDPHDFKLWCEVNEIVKDLSHDECSLVQILGGTQQVVAGVIYDLVILINSWDGCNERICHLKYWAKPYPHNKEPEILEQDCFPCSWECGALKSPCLGKLSCCTKAESKLTLCDCKKIHSDLESIIKKMSGKWCLKNILRAYEEPLTCGNMYTAYTWLTDGHHSKQCLIRFLLNDHDILQPDCSHPVLFSFR